MMNTFEGIQVDKFTRLHLESPKLIRLMDSYENICLRERSRNDNRFYGNFSTGKILKLIFEKSLNLF